MELELISFDLCPYVQRSVITLKYKKADFKVTYIDLANKPEWFLKISPLGKVPALRVGNEAVLFESAVINEYIDETVGTPLMSKDSLRKAVERAWIEFGSSILMTSYQATMEKDPAKMEQLVSKLFTDLEKVMPMLKDGPFFRGSEFSLVDTSWAPIFMRLFLSEKLNKDPRWEKIHKVRKWGEELMKLPAVQESVPSDFNERYVKYCREKGSLLF